MNEIGVRRIPASILWPGIIVGFMLMSLTMVTITVVAAVQDPSFAIVEDYHDKALRWDEHRAEVARSESLGWTVGLTAVRPDTGARSAPLAVTLADAEGRPIEGAAVEAEIFHHARAHSARTFALTATGEPGVYEAPGAIDRRGFWQVRLRVEAGGRSFTTDRAVEALTR